MFSIFQFFFSSRVWNYGLVGIGEKWDAGSVMLFIGCLLAIAAAGYLCGSVNSAIILTRFVYKEDIRQEGEMFFSHNLDKFFPDNKIVYIV